MSCSGITFVMLQKQLGFSIFILYTFGSFSVLFSSSRGTVAKTPLVMFFWNILVQVVASYFPLPQCIEGLKVLVESLFGATFHTVPLAPGESWHPDVLKMSLHHPDEVCCSQNQDNPCISLVNVNTVIVHSNFSHPTPSLFPHVHKSCNCFLQGDLGYLYLDLYSRKDKYPGCASFAIRGGRKISETEYQLPV